MGLRQGLDGSAPRSALRPVSEVGHRTGARIRLEFNGVVVQQGTLDEMIWPVADIISYISRFVTLAPGDLIFSGTPAGVGPLQSGDHVRGGVDGLATFECDVGQVPRSQ